MLFHRLLLFPLALQTPGSVQRPTPPILDKQAILTRYAAVLDNRDWSWYEARIPFFESPDAQVDATYYYRWDLVTRHLTYGSPQSGYTFSEFIDRPFWSGAYGAISCPVGHQMYEVRWLKDQRIVGDFAHYWFDTRGAEPRSYSNWYGDAVWATYLVNGDRQFIRTTLPDMKAQYAGWVAEHWDSAHAMFHWDGLHDGMEVNINSRLTTDPGSGADGYRPTINSYLFADARAISAAALLLGDSATARDYADRAANLKERVQHELWDPTRDFFFHQFAHDEKGGITAGTLTYQSGPFAGNPHGREEIGFVPWQFNLPDSGYVSAWRFLMDTAYFFATHGPTTVERHDPQFEISPQCCVWSGNAWPYATTQTLVAMANLLDNYHQSVISMADYFRLFKVYTLDQRKDGRPYIAEAANPDNGSWDGHNTFDHSEHYFHSGYVDLVITGLAGLRPRQDDTLEVAPLAPVDWQYFALDDVAYHGHRVSIIWDRTGTRYGRGAGLTLFADGRVIGHAAHLGRLTAYLGPATMPPTFESRVNVAVNNGGSAYPTVTTSYSAPGTSPRNLTDGNYWYDLSPPNRWTTTGSLHASDWAMLDFGIVRSVESVKLYILDDSAGVRAPASYQVEMWRNNRWMPIPGQRRSPAHPTGHRANTVSFAAVRTSKLRVVLTHRPGASSGLTELEAWSPDTLPLAAPIVAPTDLAWGADVTASFTSLYDRLAQINDMTVAFSRYSRNRWTAFGSPHASDWVQFRFAARRRVARLELYLWGDGGGVKAPLTYTVQTWDGTAWVDARTLSQVPERPEVSSVNTVRIAPVVTDKVRIVFQHALPAATGVTEVTIWGR